MRWSRVQLTVRWIMAAVEGAALVSLVASNAERPNGITDKRVVLPVASVVAALYGLGAMHRPLRFLSPLLAVWIITPQVDHPKSDVINLSEGCFLGWFIGAPTGWISRRLTRASHSLPAASETPLAPRPVGSVSVRSYQSRRPTDRTRSGPTCHPIPEPFPTSASVVLTPSARRSHDAPAVLLSGGSPSAATRRGDAAARAPGGSRPTGPGATTPGPSRRR